MRAVLAVAGAALVAGVLVASLRSDPRAEVEAKIQEFAHAVARRDYRTVCHDVLAPALATRLGLYGAPCPHLLRVALRQVQHPIVSIGKITIHGSRASVVTLTIATGQPASLDTIQLLDTDQGWRITSLATPLTRAGVR